MELNLNYTVPVDTESKTAMIFGITGQDGSYLAEFLLSKQYKVIGVKRRVSINTLGRLTNILDNENFTLIDSDITDCSNIFQIVEKYRPGEIYNLAAQSQVGTSFQQPIATMNIDLMGPLYILEACRLYSPETKIYQASTSEMFGNNYDEIILDKLIQYQDENTVLMPTSPYAVAKVGAHHLCRLYRDAYNLFACSGILFNHCSPRRGEYFVTRKITKWIGEFIHWMGKDKIICQHEQNYIQKENSDSKFPKLKLGNISAARDWMHAKDAIRAMYLILQHSYPDDYVIATGMPHTVSSFLDEAFKYINIDNPSDYILIDTELYRPSDVNYLCGNAKKANTILNWRPRISFDKLVQEMVQADIELASHK
jgi:GDPmannose 4,6-dehydratase